MFLSEPQHMPCNDCGASVARAEREAHRCDAERRLDYEVFKLCGDVAALDEEFGIYLESRAGRFAEWYAARTRRPRPES